MSRQTVVFVALALALVFTACANDLPVDAGAPTSIEESAKVAPSTEPRSEPSTTTTTSTTSTTTTAAEMVETADTPPTLAPQAPVEALRSFRWDFRYTVSADPSSSVVVESTGTFAGGDYDCTITTELGEGSVDVRVVSVGGMTWLDEGTGPAPVAGTDRRVGDSVVLCPGSAAFWTAIMGNNLLPGGGNLEVHDGIDTRRVDLTSIHLNDRPTGFGSGLVIDSVVYWVAIAGDWIEAVEMTAGVDPNIVASVTGTTTSPGATATVSVTIDRADDDSLTVTAP